MSGKLPYMRESSCAFVILTWNSSAYIERCLDSVFMLPFRELTVLLFDNGSIDGTAELVERKYASYLENDGFPKLVLKGAETNLGTTVSRNALLSEIDSTIDYICVLDSDTEVNEDAFEAMCTHFAEDDNSRIGVIGPRMRNDAGELQLSGRNLPTISIKAGKGIPFHAIRERAAKAEICDTPTVNGQQDVGYLLSACWLFPYETLSLVGTLDEKIFYAPEDVDWCARVHEAGLRVVLAHDAEIVHSYQRISQKKLISRTNISHIKGLIHYFAKHGYLFRSKKIWTNGPKDSI